MNRLQRILLTATAVTAGVFVSYPVLDALTSDRNYVEAAKEMDPREPTGISVGVVAFGLVAYRKRFSDD